MDSTPSAEQQLLDELKGQTQHLKAEVRELQQDKKHLREEKEELRATVQKLEREKDDLFAMVQQLTGQARAGTPTSGTVHTHTGSQWGEREEIYCASGPVRREDAAQEYWPGCDPKPTLVEDEDELDVDHLGHYPYEHASESGHAQVRSHHL